MFGLRKVNRNTHTFETTFSKIGKKMAKMLHY